MLVTASKEIPGNLWREMDDKQVVVVLGAGKPFQGNVPSALVSTPTNGRVLDWILEAFSQIPGATFNFIGGYRVYDIAQHYPRITITSNPTWQSTGSLGSFFLAPLDGKHVTYVCYSDTVFAPEVVERLYRAEGDVVVVVDRAWKDRYPCRSTESLMTAEKVHLDGDRLTAIGPRLSIQESSSQFTGLLKLSPPAVERALALRDQAYDSLSRAGIPMLVELLLKSGLDIRVVEIAGEWAELDAPEDLARFVLGTKADTLRRLRPLLRQSTIDEQIRFTVGEWLTDRGAVLTSIVKKFGSRLVVVRSSALGEDSWATSRAGAHKTVLDVPAADQRELTSAVEIVISSYTDHTDVNPDHQVLVQPMLKDTTMSGVVFTRTLNYRAPYYVINYDSKTTSTSTVTSGAGESLETAVLHRDWALEDKRDENLGKVVKAVQEVEELVGYDSLDIEFALGRDGQARILQVRPLTGSPNPSPVTDSDVSAALTSAGEAFQRSQRAIGFLLGKRTFFGVMPDWNPAEMIGTKPRPLALSLYQYLITESVWATQRAQYGYRDVRPCPLMVTLAGHPYIDIRVDFNSFIPACLPRELAERLVNHYMDWLEARPHLHDKVEFDVVFTCLTFDFDEQAKDRLLSCGFGLNEVKMIKGALRQITKCALTRSEKDLRDVKNLEERYELMKDELNPLDRAGILLKDCRRYGTVPFAHLARTAFIAVSLLRSLERVGITTQKETEQYLSSVGTVTREFEHDGLGVAGGRLAWASLLARYGHLRPGTYEITSPSYADDPEFYLKPLVTEVIPEVSSDEPFRWDAATRSAIRDALRSIGLPEDVERFDGFLRQAIKGREYAKFAFSRNLSTALDEFIRFGAAHGLTREQLSYVTLQDLLSLQTVSPASSVRDWIGRRAEEGERWHFVARAVELPPLIFRVDDIFAFRLPHSQPNFVTRMRVVGETYALSASRDHRCLLPGKIVLIPQADPGYDWLFGHGIKGLITMYGGANSHMAIRAAELSIPAAIGAGEALFERLSHAKLVDLDCMNGRIELLR
jgi:glutamine kinase